MRYAIAICLSLAVVSTCAETLNDCAHLKNDAEHWCRAMATLSVDHCERIINYGVRAQCHLEVAHRSRLVRNR
jgi:hypothetical protein